MKQKKQREESNKKHRHYKTNLIWLTDLCQVLLMKTRDGERMCKPIN